MVRLLCGKVEGVGLRWIRSVVGFSLPQTKKAEKIVDFGFWILDLLSLFDPKWSVKRVGRWTDCWSHLCRLEMWNLQ